MTHVYLFPLEGFDRYIADMELKEAYLNKKGVERYTLTDFIESLNNGHINLNLNRVRLIDGNDGGYPISSLYIADLKQAGFDTEKVSASDLLTLADRLKNYYLEWMYWESLEMIADGIGIPRQEETEEGQ